LRKEKYTEFEGTGRYLVQCSVKPGFFRQKKQCSVLPYLQLYKLTLKDHNKVKIEEKNIHSRGFSKMLALKIFAEKCEDFFMERRQIV